MAGTIKGITISIGGDTADLKKSLSDVEKKSKSLQSELNQVNKQLKFDPTNAVLLAQKQDILSEKIENSKEALQRLYSVQDEVEEQLKKGTIGADQYRAYQREIETTKNVIKNFENQLDELRSTENRTESDINGTDLSPAKEEIKGLKDEIGNLESTAKKTNLSSLKEEIDDVKSASSDLKDTLKNTGTEIGAAFAVAGGGAVAAFKSYDSFESAMKSLQAATGIDNSGIGKLRDTLEEIYTSGYGESLEEIASRMANIVQATGETDPEKLRAYTTNLYGLQDAFNMDYSETLRGVQGLVNNMGLSAEDAFDYIAKGAQNGLNYTNELGDNIAEYSQIWGQAGFSTKEMFSILENGTKSGAYNLDKVNAFVQEFTYSLADGRIEENLGSFSDNTADLFNKWKDGKATASEVFYSVINDLATAENKQEALTVASNTWSSLGEDNALSVITSLNNVNTNYDNVVDTMNKVNEVKYDTAGNSLEKLGRKAQTEILNPLVEDIYPEIEDGIDWIADNLYGLIPIIEGVATEVALVWGVKKVNDITKGVINLISTYKNLATATKTATDVQKGLNAAQKANVISAVATAVITLVTAIDTYNDTKWENSSINKELDKAQELTDNWTSLAEDMTSKIDEINNKEITLKADINNVNEMKDKLQEIIEDGTIDENEVGQYKTIIDLMSEKVDGFDTQWNSLTLEKIDGKIVIKDNIDEVNSKIDQLVTDWEIAQAKLMMSDVYNDLMTQKETMKIEMETSEQPNVDRLTENLENYIYDKSNLSKEESEYLTQKIIEADGDFYKAIDYVRSDFANGKIDGEEFNKLRYDITKDYFSPFNDVASNIFGFNNIAGQAYDEVTEQGKALAEANNALKDAEAAYGAINDKLGDYQNGMEALNGGLVDYSYYVDLATEHGLSHETVLSLIKDKSIKTWDDLLEAAKKQSKNTGSTYSNGVKSELTSTETNESFGAVGQSMGYHVVAGAKNADYKGAGTYAGDQFAQGVNLTNLSVEKAGIGTANAVNIGSQKVSLLSAGASLIGTLIGGIFGRNRDSETAGETSANQAKSGAGKVRLFSTGSSLIGAFINGIFGRNRDSETAGETSAKKAKSGAGKVRLFSTGNNLVSGFVKGILDGSAFKSIAGAAASVAETAYTSIKKWLGINSPAKKTIPVGGFFDEGIVVGILRNAKKVGKATKYVAKTALNGLDSFKVSTEIFDLKTPDISSVSANLNRIGSFQPQNGSSISKSYVNQPMINVNIMGTQINNDADLDKLAQKIAIEIGNYASIDSRKWG